MEIVTSPGANYNFNYDNEFLLSLTGLMMSWNTKKYKHQSSCEGVKVFKLSTFPQFFSIALQKTQPSNPKSFKFVTFGGGALDRQILHSVVFKKYFTQAILRKNPMFRIGRKFVTLLLRSLFLI